LKAGWRHGSTTNDHAKIHSCLVRFDELPVEQQKKERRAVQQLPGLLARVGFKVHRLAASAARQ
jgi:hypothetical protein